MQRTRTFSALLLLGVALGSIFSGTASAEGLAPSEPVEIGEALVIERDPIEIGDALVIEREAEAPPSGPAEAAPADAPATAALPELEPTAGVDHPAHPGPLGWGMAPKAVHRVGG